jgi:hypothetical protein
MGEHFFERPILNNPYEYPARYWELDEHGQPTNRIIEQRRRAEFITPIPKPKKRRQEQRDLVFDEGEGLSTKDQQYAATATINELRRRIDQWRALPNPRDWLVTPETARLLQHWRHHRFNSIRPFFCQVEAVETVIWLSEVASKLVYDYLSGFHRENEDGSTTLENGRLLLFQNFDDHGNTIARPRTLLIDSERLESGEGLDDGFRAMAADEIERFRREIVERTGDRQRADNISDEEILREVMNTVGKKARLLVHRHRLQRRELLRPPRLLPRRQ